MKRCYLKHNALIGALLLVRLWKNVFGFSQFSALLLVRFWQAVSSLRFYWCVSVYINPRTGLDIVNALICPLFLQPAALLYDCKHPYSAEFCIRFTTPKRHAFTTIYGPLKRYACKDVIKAGPGVYLQLMQPPHYSWLIGHCMVGWNNFESLQIPVKHQCGNLLIGFLLCPLFHLSRAVPSSAASELVLNARSALHVVDAQDLATQIMWHVSDTAWI